MQDKKLREAFRALVRHLNLKVEEDYFFGYRTRNYPEGADCNVARKGDIQDLQEQVDKLEKKLKNIKRKR